VAKLTGDLTNLLKGGKPRRLGPAFTKRQPQHESELGGENPGALILQKKPRPHEPSRVEFAWVSNFSCIARFTKAPWSGDFNEAHNLQDQTGWYWRDVIHSALSGKLIGDPRKRVTTPTARVFRTGMESLVSGQLKALTPNDTDWDNNFFWDPVSNSTRLTIRSKGVYLVGCQIEYNAVSGGRRVAILRVNGTTVIGDQSIGAVASNLVRVDPMTVWAFNENDYVEACAFANASGVQAELENFWVVAITPEAVI